MRLSPTEFGGTSHQLWRMCESSTDHSFLSHVSRLLEKRCSLLVDLPSNESARKLTTYIE